MTTPHDQPRHYFDAVPVLSDHRVTLRGITADDAASLVEISAYDGVMAASTAEALEFLEKIHLDCARGESIHWGICVGASPRVVGTCGYYRGYRNNTGEIGYVLGSGHRGRGIMTAAVGLIVDFGLNVMNLDRVVAFTASDNSGSIAVLQRTGFQLTGDEAGELAFVITRPSAARGRSVTG